MSPTPTQDTAPKSSSSRSLEDRLLGFVQKRPKRALILAVVALIWGLSSLVVISWGGGFAVSSTDPFHWTHHPLDRLDRVTRVTAQTTESTVHLSICFELLRNGDLDHEPHQGMKTYQVLVDFDRREPAPVTVPRDELREGCVDPEGHQPFPTSIRRTLADTSGPSFLNCTHSASSGDGMVLGCYVDPARDLRSYRLPPVRLARVPPHQHTNYDAYLQRPLAWIIDLATAPLFVVFLAMMGLGGVPATP